MDGRLTSLPGILDLEKLVSLSAIRVGRIWFRPRDVERLLFRFCKKLFFLNEFEGIPYSFRGCSTALKFGDQHLLFCTNHQLSGYQADQVGICPDAGREFILTADRMIYPEIGDINADGEIIDVRALNFPIHSYGIDNFQSEFFEVLEGEQWSVGRERVFIVYGYPTEFQDFDYFDAGFVRGRCLQTVGVYNGQSNAPYVHRLTMLRRGTFDSDGMSGGAVFYLDTDSEGFFVGLAGMVLRGSASDLLHFIEAKALALFVSPME